MANQKFNVYGMYEGSFTILGVEAENADEAWDKAVKEVQKGRNDNHSDVVRCVTWGNDAVRRVEDDE